MPGHPHPYFLKLLHPMTPWVPINCPHYHFALALSLEIRYSRECISAGSGAGVSLKGLQPRATLRHSLALVLLSAFSFFKKWGSTVRAEVCPPYLLLLTARLK